jgi:hypothetical protein
MKKFPIVDFDFKAEDQSQNLKQVIATVLSLREDGMTWRAIEEPYRSSKYAEHLGWQKVYKAATTAEKVAVPPPVKPEPAQKAKPASAPAVEIKIDNYIKAPTQNSGLLRELIMRDLKSPDSIILADIEARLKAGK